MPIQQLSPTGSRQIVCSPEYKAFPISPQSQVDSSYRSVCVFPSCKDGTRQFGGRTAVDELLQDLIDEICRCEDPSPERQKALNRLLAVVQQLPGIKYSKHPDYLQALNQTWEWVSRKIGEFEPRSSSVQQSLVTWINGYLNWRIRDLYIPEDRNSISLDRPISNNEGEITTLGDRLPAMTLDLLEAKIVQIQEKQRQRIGQRVRQYIQQDPEGILKSCHPRKHPDCNCQLLAMRMLLQEPPQRIADIAREFNINNQTLYSHWKNNCLPLLQEKGRTFGY